MNQFVQVRREKITPEFRLFILERDNHTCRYCGSRTPPFHLDHVYPVIKGGETSLDNIVTACISCNAKKHSRIGIWPKPIGYFDGLRFQLYHIFMSPVVLGFLSTILLLMYRYETTILEKSISLSIGLFNWMILIKSFRKGGL